MPTLLKKILIVFAIIIGISIIIVPFLPKPKLTFSERFEIMKVIDEMNRELPEPIGSIGQLEKVSFVNDTLCFHSSIYGDSNIDNFYEENYNELREISKYACLTLNGQRNGGTKLANLLDSKGIIIKMIATTPSFKKFNFTFSGRELLDFIAEVKMSPTEAFYTIIDTHIRLANLSLPLELDDFDYYQSITNNSIRNFMGDGDRLIKILHARNDVIFIFETYEKEFRINDIKPYINNELFLNELAKELVEDQDFKEFVDMLVMSHSNFTFSYINPNSYESVNITIPYRILKNYCTFNPLDLL